MGIFWKKERKLEFSRVEYEVFSADVCTAPGEFTFCAACAKRVRNEWFLMFMEWG